MPEFFYFFFSPLIKRINSSWYSCSVFLHNYLMKCINIFTEVLTVKRSSKLSSTIQINPPLLNRNLLLNLEQVKYPLVALTVLVAVPVDKRAQTFHQDRPANLI